MFAHQSRRSEKSASILDRWASLTAKQKALLAICLLLVVAVLYFWSTGGLQKTFLVTAQADETMPGQSDNPENPLTGKALNPVLDQTGAIAAGTDSQESLNPNTNSLVYVHVSGAVIEPGVVSLPLGSRLVDAVASCGGLCEDAASDYINLAAPLIDGTHTYIPHLSDIEALRQQGIAPEQELLNGMNWNNPEGPLSTNASVSTSNGDAAASEQSGFPVDINKADSATLQTVPGIGPVTAQRIIDYRSQHGPYQRVEDLIQISGIGEKRLADMQPYLTCK